MPVTINKKLEMPDFAIKDLSVINCDRETATGNRLPNQIPKLSIYPLNDELMIKLIASANELYDSHSLQFKALTHVWKCY